MFTARWPLPRGWARGISTPASRSISRPRSIPAADGAVGGGGHLVRRGRCRARSSATTPSSRITARPAGCRRSRRRDRCAMPSRRDEADRRRSARQRSRSAAAYASAGEARRGPCAAGGDPPRHPVEERLYDEAFVPGSMSMAWTNCAPAVAGITARDRRGARRGVGDADRSARHGSSPMRTAVSPASAPAPKCRAMAR